MCRFDVSLCCVSLQDMRRHVMMTLLDTEQSYVDSLRTLIQVQQLSFSISFYVSISQTLLMFFFLSPLLAVIGCHLHSLTLHVI